MLSSRQNWEEYEHIRARAARSAPERRCSSSSSPSAPAARRKKRSGALLAGLRERDREAVNEAASGLFDEFLLVEAGNFDLIRMRLIELFTMLSKAALDSGINLNKILAAGLDPLEALNQAQSVEELAVWTQKLIDHFFSLVPEPPAPVYSPLITQAIELIGERYAEKLTLRDVAGSIHINESYLSKLFKKRARRRLFTDYLNSLRIQKSVELLSQPDMNLLEIAGRVGFDDQSYFTKVFKKITGKTPRQFKVSASADKLLRQRVHPRLPRAADRR